MVYQYGTYTCPDCGAVCRLSDLIYPTTECTMLVCPHCGVVQESNDVEQMLGKEG